jgi:hemolysin III
MFSYWVAIGGLFYTVGAVIYGLKKPDPFPEKFGFHEIWHLFVLGGAFSHFWGIYKFLPGYIISS